MLRLLKRWVTILETIRKGHPQNIQDIRPPSPPFPPCQNFELISRTKFKQPHLQCLLLGISPINADFLYGCPLATISSFILFKIQEMRGCAEGGVRAGEDQPEEGQAAAGQEVVRP